MLIVLTVRPSLQIHLRYGRVHRPDMKLALEALGSMFCFTFAGTDHSMGIWHRIGDRVELGNARLRISHP